MDDSTLKRGSCVLLVTLGAEMGGGVAHAFSENFACFSEQARYGTCLPQPKNPYPVIHTELGSTSTSLSEVAIIDAYTEFPAGFALVRR